MALRVSRREFLGVDELGIPEPEVMSAKMVLDFEVEVFCRMEDLGITQKDLAERLGVTPATVSKTLSKTSNMTFKTAARIASALGCVLDAPTLRVFDADEYDKLYVEAETSSTDSSAGKADYKSTVQSEARSVRNGRQAERPVIASATDKQMGWGLAA